MARIRTVKPEFWLDEDLANLPPHTRLLAIGLLNQSDDEGYFRAAPALLRGAIFPFEDSVNVPVMLRELSSVGYIRIASGDDGKEYGWVVNFLKHQVVNKPKHSEIKELCEFHESSGSDTVLIPDDYRGERKGKERKGNGKGMEHDIPSSLPSVADSVQQIFNYWKLVMGKTDQAKLTPKRERAVRALLKLGYSVDQIKQGIDGCKRSPYHMGQNDNRTVYDDIELICRSGEKLEQFITNTGKAAGVETIDQFRDRAGAQGKRLLAILEARDGQS